MAKIYQLPTSLIGSVGVFPNQKFCVFGDDLSTVTTAGYLNEMDLTSNPVSPSDILIAFYDYDQNTQSGTYATFGVSVSNLGVVTLFLDDPGTGTVDPSAINNLAYYAAAGNEVSGIPTANNSVLTTGATGIPSLSTTLPNGLAMGTPASLTLTNADGLPLSGLDVGTNSAMMVTNSSGAATTVGPMTDGQIVVGATGSTPVATTITAGGNITVTNGPGTITLSSASFQWLDVSEESVTMEINKGYIASNAGLVTLTLPAVAPVGSRVAVQDSGAGGWRIAQNSEQIVRSNSGQSTVGITGTVSSSQVYDVIYVLCVVENTNWVLNGGSCNYVFV